MGLLDVALSGQSCYIFERADDVAVLRQEPDGFLALGAAETVVGLTDGFKPHADKRGLYRPTAPRAAPSIGPAMASAGLKTVMPMR